MQGCIRNWVNNCSNNASAVSFLKVNRRIKIQNKTKNRSFLPKSNSDTRLILFHYFEKSHAMLLGAHIAAHMTLDHNTILSGSVFQQLIFGRADAQGMGLGSSLVDLIACLLVADRAVITHERALCNSQLCRPFLGCGEHVRA